MADVRLMTLDPGHFHAALIQKEMYAGVAARVDVFAPLGPDLFEHLKRIVSFNGRSDRPTTWQTEAHASPDFFERMLRERLGNVVVFSGRNRGKIDQIAGAVHAGLQVLGDKPWILKSEDRELQVPSYKFQTWRGLDWTTGFVLNVSLVTFRNHACGSGWPRC